MRYYVNGILSFSLMFAPAFAYAAKAEIDTIKIHKMGAETLLKSIKKIQKEGTPVVGTKSYDTLVRTFPFMKKFIKDLNEPKVQKKFENLRFVKRGDSALTIKYGKKILDFSSINYHSGTFILNGEKFDLLKVMGKEKINKADIVKKETGLFFDILIPKAHALFGHLGDFSLDWFFGTGAVLLGAGLIFGAPFTFPMIAGGLLLSAVAGFAGPALTGIGKKKKKKDSESGTQ